MSAVAEQQKIWDDMLQRLFRLSSLTVNRNAELSERISELEMECQLWKKSHALAVENAERDAKVYQLQLSALNKQLSGTDLYHDQDPFIFCVINGDKTFFSENLLSQGQAGGRQAAQMLTKAIAERLSNDDLQVFGRISYWVYLYIDRIGVYESLAHRGVCSRDQFETFLLGFSQASSRFSMIDVGPGREMVDLKIKEFLQTFIKFPQTMRIFMSGGDDPNYANLFSHLEQQSLLGKLVMIRNSAAAPADATFSVPSIYIDNLFVLQSPSQTPRPTLNVVHPNITSNGGLISPKSPPPPNSRPIDPLLPLHKQAPPPCNEYYLMTCSKGPGVCKYSHEYQLTPEQLSLLAQNAKKAPCNFLKNGLPCPYAERCCWGHVCPNGPNCYHKSKGKCWFKNMHGP